MPGAPLLPQPAMETAQSPRGKIFPVKVAQLPLPGRKQPQMEVLTKQSLANRMSGSGGGVDNLRTM